MAEKNENNKDSQTGQVTPKKQISSDHFLSESFEMNEKFKL